MKTKKTSIPAPLERLVRTAVICEFGIKTGRGTTVFSRRIELFETPIVGDEICVWADNKGGLRSGPSVGMYLRVAKRRWDSRDGIVRLWMVSDYERTEEDLKSQGWK